MWRVSWSAAFGLLLMVGCVGVDGRPFTSIDAPAVRALVGSQLSQGTGGFPWWNDTVFYEIFVRSFQDSDGDGIGDIQGLINRLDYLNDGDPTTNTDLGVTGIWLMPIAESPSYHGYDVVDYYAIERDYGTMEDFRLLMEEAHKRGIRVIVDLVLNHTSTRHPWFLDSINADSPRRDWYIWRDESPGYRGPWGQEVWHALAGSHYYGIFWSGMPDLNYANPAVTAQMQDVTRFWLEEVGVDGFRLDAIKHLVEAGRIQENTDETHAWLEGYYDFYKAIDPDALTVGEAWTATFEVLDYTGDEVDIAFQFELAETMLNAGRYGAALILIQDLKRIVNRFPPHQYATFLTNHDQNRVMSQLSRDVDAAKNAASLLLTGPGVPFVYYGEEIGMTGTKPDEDIRRPMQWTADGERAGFTSGQPWRAPARDTADVNVRSQQDNPESLLSHYRRLIHLRNQNEALRIGGWTPVAVERAGTLYAFLRESDNQTLLVLINLDEDPLTDYALTLESEQIFDAAQPTVLLGDVDAAPIKGKPEGGFEGYVPVVEVEAHEVIVLRLR